MSVSLAPLPESRVREAVELLADAFQGDPNLRWCFLADRPGYEQRLRGYLLAGHAWHTGIGQPVEAAFAGDELVAVAYASDADAAPGEADVARLHGSLERDCGAEVAGRFLRYNRAVEAASPEGPHHVLALIAVLSQWRGRGVGSQLVRWLCARCDADPGSRGVLLDTATERNVAFYRRHGFEVAAEVPLGDDVVEHVMVRLRG